MTRYNGNRFLQYCTLTNSNPKSYHPLARRFTKRENACLQGFPVDYQFGEHGFSRQIGNAFPAVVATVFFKALRQALREADGLSL